MSFLYKTIVLFALISSTVGCSHVISTRPANDEYTLTDSKNNIMWARKVVARTHNMDGKIININDSLESYGTNYYSYHDALSFIDKLNNFKYAGYSDWRLPDTNELKMLVDIAKQKRERIQNSLRLQKKQIKYHTSLDKVLAELGYFTDGSCWSSEKISSEKVLIVPLTAGFNDFSLSERSTASSNRVCPIRNLSPSTPLK